MRHLVYCTHMAQALRSLLSFAVVDLAGSVVRFPVWWYSDGVVAVARWGWQGLRYRARAYAIPLWLRHFFVPMYGEHEWSGRLISVLMRFVVIFFRAIALGIEALVYALIVLLWMGWPPIALFLLVVNISDGIGWNPLTSVFSSYGS